jgi:hypothetical protein
MTKQMARDLLLKWRAGTITAQERNDLLQEICEQFFKRFIQSPVDEAL